MKHVLASKDRESSFHYCGSTMKPVQACLSTKKELESWFHHNGGTVILVPACLCMCVKGLIKSF